MDSTPRRINRAFVHIRRALGCRGAHSFTARASRDPHHPLPPLVPVPQHVQGEIIPRHHGRRRRARHVLHSPRHRFPHWNKVPVRRRLGASHPRRNIARSITGPLVHSLVEGYEFDYLGLLALCNGISSLARHFLSANARLFRYPFAKLMNAVMTACRQTQYIWA